jgi:hypothetical protein
VDGASSVSDAQAQAWFNDSLKANYGGTAPRLPSTLGLGNLSDITNPDPVPAIGSEPDTARVEFGDSLAAPFFDTTATYRGAFAPGVPMSSQWTAGWTNFNPQNTKYFQVNNSWNLVSVSRVVSDFSATAVFPTAVPGSVNGTLPTIYTPGTTLVNGEGYWALYSTAQTLAQVGGDLPTTAVTVPAANRWVLLGSTSTNKPVSALTTSVPGSIVAVWGWNGTAYVPVTTLEATKAYWVFVNAACTLTIN